MNITILGADQAGALLAQRLAQGGHAVRIAAHDPSAAQAVAAAHAGITAVLISEAVDGSSVVVIAPGYADSAHALHGLGSLEDKLLVDMTFPTTDECGSGDAAPGSIANAFCCIDMIRSFNRLFALDDVRQATHQVVPVFYAGDSEHGRRLIAALIQSIHSSEAVSVP